MRRILAAATAALACMAIATTANAATKIALHAGLFQPATTAAFLASQPLLRGDGWAAARALLAKRFAQAYAAGASTFVVGGLLVYSLPSVALQSALRNLGVLAFGIYLALVSN